MRLHEIKTELELNKVLEHEKGYKEILGFINDYFEIIAKLRESRSTKEKKDA